MKLSFYRLPFKKKVLTGLLFFSLLGLVICPFMNRKVYCSDTLKAPMPIWPPKGQSVKCRITSDTWLSSVGKERFGSNGGAKKLKLKGQQEYILFDIDQSVLQGEIITGALLHVRSATPFKAPLARVGISTLGAQWEEGSSKNYKLQKGSSCFTQAAYEERNWAYHGSTLMDVCFGRGHTIWKFADCTPPDQNGWQTCAVDPDVVGARLAGISSGFCVYDEVGSMWSYKNGKFKYIYYPNRFIYSRESGNSAPWLEVWVNETDFIPPEPVKKIQVETDDLPPGEALVRWDTPKDSGGGKTLGFHVSYNKGGKDYQVPKYLIPMAGFPGDKVRMHLQDLPFQPGDNITLCIRPVDSAGNIGSPFTQKIRLSSKLPMTDIPDTAVDPFKPDTILPEVNGLKIAVVDLLDKIDPRTGRMIPSHSKGYKGGNHIYCARKRLIRLQSARNEHITFQINLEGHARNVSVKYTFDQCPNLNPQLFQFAYVRVNNKKGEAIFALPDPLIPLSGVFSIPSTAGQVRIPNQNNHSLICELYVPHEEPPGLKTGKILISVAGKKIELDVALTVWNFTLPNKLSFVPEMNAYSKVSPYKSYKYYRLAHEHRTCINRLPYGWNCQPEFAPKWEGGSFDWEEWDRKVKPLLDGSAFSDLPRKDEPVDMFYLPFNENWPVNIFENYSPSYWADEAFTLQYSEELKKAFSAFAKHVEKQKWHDTIFQFYLNNKIYYRRNYNESSAPWLFDEPQNTQDFWALRWYGLLWHLAVNPVSKTTKMWFRGDISYTQFSRDMLWGIMDIEYIGFNTPQKIRMKHDEWKLFGKSYFAEYGSANKIRMPNVQPVIWCLSAWSKGAMGVLPWQTIGSQRSWKVSDQNSLFYPQPKGPLPSVRLKAFRRGQQDVEYLTIFCDVYKKPRYAVAAWLQEIAEIKESIDRSLQADAKAINFNNLDAVELWKIRYCLGKMLSERGPTYKRSLVHRKTPVFNSENLPDIGYVSVSPDVRRQKPDCKNFSPCY